MTTFLYRRMLYAERPSFKIPQTTAPSATEFQTHQTLAPESHLSMRQSPLPSRRPDSRSLTRASAKCPRVRSHIPWRDQRAPPATQRILSGRPPLRDNSAQPNHATLLAPTTHPRPPAAESDS